MTSPACLIGPPPTVYSTFFFRRKLESNGKKQVGGLVWTERMSYSIIERKPLAMDELDVAHTPAMSTARSSEGYSYSPFERIRAAMDSHTDQDGLPHGEHLASTARMTTDWASYSVFFRGLPYIPLTETNRPGRVE